MKHRDFLDSDGECMTPSRAPSRFRSYLIPVLSTVLGLLAACGWVLLFGRVQGLEFCPRTFEFRSFSYVEVPLLRIQVWPVSRETEAHEAADYLVAQGYVGKQNPAKAGTDQDNRGKQGPDERSAENADETVSSPSSPTSPSSPPSPTSSWHLVNVNRNGNIGKGDADLLYRSLNLRDHSSQSVWIRWSEGHQDMAKVLWPEVERLAELELYFLIPPLLEAVLGEKDLMTMERTLQQRLFQAVRLHAETQAELGRHRNALQLYDEALRHIEPGSAEADAVRAARQKSAGSVGAAGEAQG